MSLATPASVVEHHVPCIGCGYDLFASAAAGNCPECGRDVDVSLRALGALSIPSNAITARAMSTSLLVSSLFAGLCPAACLLLLNLENAIGAVAMSVAFLVCAVSGAHGEVLRSRIAGIPAKSGSRGSPRWADLVAAVGLLCVNVAGYLYAAKQALIYNSDYSASVNVEWASMICVAVGFFLLCIMAWRAIPTWLAQADVARALRANRLAGFMTFMAWAKGIYETIWLACCWTPFVGGLLDSSSSSSLTDLMIYPAVGAAFGLIGFAAIWLMMIIAHVILLVHIRKRTASTLQFELKPG